MSPVSRRRAGRTTERLAQRNRGAPKQGKVHLRPQASHWIAGGLALVLPAGISLARGARRPPLHRSRRRQPAAPGRHPLACPHSRTPPACSPPPGLPSARSVRAPSPSAGSERSFYHSFFS